MRSPRFHAPMFPLVLLGAVFLAPCARAGFTSGDLVLLSASSGAPGNTPAALLIKASPLAVSILSQDSGITGDGAFDAYRNRVAARRSPDAFGWRISLLDSDGSWTDLPFTGNRDVSALAPAGDGRIYFQRPGKFSYIDAAGVTRDVLNTSGSNIYVPPRAWSRMYFDLPTQSLFLGDSQGLSALITRIKLTPDGSRVAGPPADTVFVTASLSNPRVVGITQGPNGHLFIKLDDNSNNTAPRMLLMNPATLEVDVYANSGYFGVAGEIAGCFSPALNAALAVDSLSDRLRIFTSGGSIEGAIVLAPLVSSPGGSGENATLFPITLAASTCPGDINNDGQVDDSDFVLFLTGYNLLDCADPAMPAGCPSDFNHDGFVDDSDFIIFVVAYNALVCP